MTGLRVIDPGLSTTVQDAGRPGYRERGVSPGGAFDRGSADLANALLGNFADCAVLELTLNGGVYEAAGPLALAMAGAPMEAKVVGPEGIEQSLRIPLCWSLLEGERLILGRTREGARTYLAVRGGWQTPRPPRQSLVGISPPDRRCPAGRPRIHAEAMAYRADLGVP